MCLAVSSSATRLSRGRVPRLTTDIFCYLLPHTRQSGETMTSVSVYLIILTPTQPVGSGETMTSISVYLITVTLIPTHPVGSEQTMTSVSICLIILTPTQSVGSGETMTSVSVYLIILTPTQPVGSGTRPPDQALCTLPTELIPSLVDAESYGEI